MKLLTFQTGNSKGKKMIRIFYVILGLIAFQLLQKPYVLAACSQSGSTYSCYGSNPTWVAPLSTNIFMNYKVENGQFRYYTLAIGHKSGSKVYASSQANTRIFFKDFTEITQDVVSGAALSPALTSPYLGTSGWTAL